MIVLVLNCGSSSLKYQLLDMKSDEVFTLKAKGLVERIGMDMGHLKHRAEGKEILEFEEPVENHTVAVKKVLDALTDPTYGCLNSLEELDAVGHRVLHGGSKIFKSMLVNKEVEETIEECFDLGPLHNPANLRGIKAFDEVLPDLPQVAVFDTAFHQSMPAESYMYAIPYEYYEKYQIRKYGFHGTSHRYVSAAGAKYAGIDINNSKIVTCHLGNGSSISAVVNGKCVDTSMGLTPLDGMIMGTRAGSVDPAVVTYLQKKENLGPAEIDTILNKKSGLLGLGGVSSDMRDNFAAAGQGNERAQLVIKKLVNDVCKLVGGYIAEMNGADLIIFTGGIGENNYNVRRMIMEHLGYMGVKVNTEVNEATMGDEAVISTEDSKLKVIVFPTNEELMIARDTMHLVEKAK